MYSNYYTVNFEQHQYPKGNLYAIGDIHGCDNALNLLLDLLIMDNKLSTDDKVIFLGDYIDRGQSSKGVIETLIDFQKQYPATEFLRGNHEDMFLSFFGQQGLYGDSYLRNGGDEVLKEYGLNKLVRQKMSGIHFLADKPTLYSKLPPSHREFVENTKMGLEFPDLIFVHAGLNIFQPLTKQSNEDVVWMRDPFLGAMHHFGKWVVHGHTPTNEVYFNAPYEINLDTGCVFGDLYGNKLSCIKFNLRDIINSEIIDVVNPDPGY